MHNDLYGEVYGDLYGAHIREMQSRWEAAMLAENCEAILVHAGSPILSFMDDYQYAFRPNPHFLAWLPLTHHYDSVLLIRPGERPLLWYFQPEDYWHLPPSDPETWWGEQFEVRIVPDTDSWRSDSSGLFSHCAALGDTPALQSVFSAQQINPQNLVTRLDLERTRKTPYEIACMSLASQMGARAHLAAEQAFRRRESEFDIHLSYLEACQQNDAELPYGSIVALNQHSAVLHYQQRERQKPDQYLSFLIDAGCTVNAYASDITRTYAARDGEFADLVSEMDRMQQDLAAQPKPGLNYADLHLDTHIRIASILSAAGIINIPAEDAVASGLSSVFLPHGLGHFIGLQTHDVAGLIDNEGKELARPEGHPFLRLTRKLEVGNVLTIEPGFYFIDSILRDWKKNAEASAINWDAVERLAPYGGIRIEDNVVVTQQGCDNLTRHAFASL